MTMHARCLVLPSTYRDSVVLMILSRTLADLPGIQQAAVMMGTLQNKALLQEAGLLTAEAEYAGANDLLICVLADSVAAAARAISTAQDGLAWRQSGAVTPAETAPRTLETALQRLPGANLACISVPGQYAQREARKALDHGLHVFLFSDHVELAAEEELKRLAAQRGLLVMGPDCGTAILNGIPIGFANQVPRGPVGLVSASGTGLQQVTCLLAQQGVGVSQALGVGGRDLHQRISGQSMRAALQALASDVATHVIVLISKPPDTAVARQLVGEARGVGKPCVLAFLGSDGNFALSAPLYAATTLEEAALMATALVRGAPVTGGHRDIPPHLMASLQASRAALRPEQRTVCALYCGGTLAHEALWLLRRSLPGVVSNLDSTWAPASMPGHMVLDLGAEEFTSGRPHPMIDPAGRRQQLLALAQRPEVAVVLCDVMLGWGVTADPAGALATAWAEAQQIAREGGRQLIGIATVCGAPDDPQGYTQQRQILQMHGFILAESNAQAVRLAIAALGGRSAERRASFLEPPAQEPLGSFASDVISPAVPEHLSTLFATGPQVINVGVALFAEQLAACGVPVVHVDWRPPAGGDMRLARLLERLRQYRGEGPMTTAMPAPIETANAQALERIFAARPFLVGIQPARDLLAPFHDYTVLHAGPPIEWQRMCGPLRGAIVGALQYEGWAADETTALALIDAGNITFRPCHSASAVGPMTGLITPSMPLMVVENRAFGNRAYATLNEGLGKVLRFGANDASVLQRLGWLQQVAAPLLHAALQRSGGLDLRVLMAQALLMGDEMHQRNVAATSLLVRLLMPHLVRVMARSEQLGEVTDYLAGNDQLFLNVAMAAAKATMDPAMHIPGCTMVTTMARNGTEFGVRISALGERWFTAPVEMPQGLYFPGFSAVNANPDMGDSAIVETLGLGAFAMAASPAVAQFVGVGGLTEARRYTAEMLEITVGRSPYMLLPTLDGLGVPSGIDIRRVVETGLVPWINTGIAHRQAGIGQIGAGVVQAPLACFVQALEAFAESWDSVPR